jgi:lipoate-protein ligase A
MKDVWRLHLSPPAGGAWNMAVDEAILEAVGRGDSLPTLRLYAWDPPCLSLGSSQPLSDVDFSRLQERGWGLVRRLTGGRAVLHSDEITYSVIGPANDPHLAGTLLESYSRIAAALVETMQLIGLSVEVQEHAETHSKTPNPVCFEVPSTAEITAGGKKLVGSAQARRKEGVLQHGSLPLTGDLRRILQVLAFENELSRTIAASHLLDRATTVEIVLGHAVSWNEAAQAFITAFQSVLNLDLQPGELSPEEMERSGKLVASKYSHPDWNRKLNS